MNLLVRQVAVLSVLWAMCEILLPEGRYQQMVRLTAGLLVMAALVTTAGQWLGAQPKAQTAITQKLHQASEDSYLRTALQAAANQVENWCVRLAQRAGYQTEVCVWLNMDGGLERIEIRVMESEKALLSPEELRSAIAQALGVDGERIWLLAENI